MQEKVSKKNISIFSWRDKTHPLAGGSTVYITEIAEHLAKKGYNVTVLTAKEGDQPESSTMDGVHYIRRGNIFTEFVVLPLYYLQHLKNKTDLLIEAYDAWPFLTTLLHKRVITIICHIQTEEWVSEFGKLLGPILRVSARFLLRAFYSKNDIVSISESTNQSIREIGLNPKKLDIIPVGIPDYFYEQEVPAKPKNEVNIVVVSRLKKHKRIDLCIKTLARYYKNHPEEKNVYLHILGRGDQEVPLKDLAQELGILNKVIFYGYATEEQKHKALQDAHLHLQFSKREGWGITVIEAASQKAPTLCFDVPGLRDSVTTETGYIVKTQKQLRRMFPKVIAAIKENSPEYKKKVELAFETSKEYSWKKILKQWEDRVKSSLEAQ